MRTAQGENTMKHTKNTKSFASRWGFILASVGSAVGMANVWGFPNKMGSNGGGAFLLIYLLFVFIFSYVGLPAEFAMGRRAATGTLGAYENAWATRGRSAGKAGGLLGWLPLAGSMCIAIGYAVIVTYILKALADSLLGTLMTADTAAWFGAFSGTPYSVIPYHIVVVVGTLLTLFLGAHSIEKTNKVMMPLFFLIFLVLAVRVALLPNAAEGYLFMFTPRWEALTDPMIWIWAMGQAFFSLSIVIGTMVTYASYFKPDTNLRHTALNVTILDTLVAILAGVVIFPAVFSVGIEPSSGPSLVFITLPSIFNGMPLSMVWSSIFFLLLVVAALTSTISLHEVVTVYLHEEWHLSRKAAAWLTTAATAALASLASLSLGALGSWKIAGLSLFDSLDFLTANILLPAGGLFTCIFVGWKLDHHILKAQITNDGELKFRIYGLFSFLLRYVCPAVLLLIFLDNLGVF